MKYYNENDRLKSVVEISTLVTDSDNFFEIKDKIVEKMLEVVHPAKACVNLFYKNNYDHAYLVCSQTLNYISKVFPIDKPIGVKIDFNQYPKYIHEAVQEQKIVYVENVFLDERAIDERELAIQEGYIGRIVFPLIVHEKVTGFMTCFLTEDDKVTNDDMNFISSVASLISLSIEITSKNNDIQNLIHKLRGAIASINDATKKLYLNKDIKSFLDHLSKQACNITKSSESFIVINGDDINGKKRELSSFYTLDKIKPDVYYELDELIDKKTVGSYSNEIHDNMGLQGVKTYIYHKLINKNDVVGYIACTNAKNYTKDDLNILSILAKQVAVAMQLYEYSKSEVKHQVLENELKILNQQQKLIMNKGNKVLDNNRELRYFHKPAKVVGGDFYHTIKKDDGTLVTILADVMGHGIVSNYVVAMIKGAFKVLAKQYDKPSEIMENINQFLFDEFDKMGVFTTCIIGVIKSNEDKMIVSNAGHYYPIGVDKNNKASFIKCSKGIPIGILEEVEYSDKEVDISKFKTVSLYTDGILEIKNHNKEEFGVERLKSFLEETSCLYKEDIVTVLKSKLWEFSQKSDFEDDILIVTLKDI
ncbi:SpoIIE family protein phosphatase [Paraclostridium ghonii]|uniref:Serine phosphatase RsbU (Regulator of sigma subunit) n=1 Tax=Paraclostridium ghonii TaxID=29358 RepID=A0ABU0MWQ0_9FIRM|nr:SpoIIE family protein phosphatase [Paeniclostridium ghonii]MDQ0554931.1 serine phosphatase RsbU (regulator of sigma subunit) [Paeniclostridium ghonii]